jgi:hypothetical protein
MLSIQYEATYITSAYYLDPNNNFAQTTVIPPFAPAYNVVSAASLPVAGVFDVGSVQAFIQSDLLFLYTDSQLC